MDLAAGHHHVNADPARLQQVFWNLIKNAVKFTPRRRGDHDPHPQRGRRRARGDRLVVEISDTGIGIEPEVLPTIFDPFQQGETTITRTFGGLGLGLAICRGSSRPTAARSSPRAQGKDRGTTFRVVLKALPEPAVGGDGEPDAGVRECEATPPSPPAAILVVEDEPATLRLMARLLRGLGHEVTTAGTIAAALEVSEAGEFDLIVSDIGLPDGSGLDLMRRVVSRHGPGPGDRPDRLRDGGGHPPQPGGGLHGPPDQADRLRQAGGDDPAGRPLNPPGASAAGPGLLRVHPRGPRVGKTIPSSVMRPSTRSGMVRSPAASIPRNRPIIMPFHSLPVPFPWMSTPPSRSTRTTSLRTSPPTRSVP